jgi:hypothetical protein
MSRVDICNAWQIAFNRLLFYASFLEERKIQLELETTELVKQEFTSVSDSSREGVRPAYIRSGTISFVSPCPRPSSSTCRVNTDSIGEVDQSLGRLLQCENTHTLPHFLPPIPLGDLTNPTNVTNPHTPLDRLTSTFLCAAREILDRNRREMERPPEHLKDIEKGLEGWEPCLGYSIVQTTGWT